MVSGVQRLQVAIFKIPTPKFGFRASSVMGRGIFQDFSILDNKGHSLFLRTLCKCCAFYTVSVRIGGDQVFKYIVSIDKISLLVKFAHGHTSI